MDFFRAAFLRAVFRLVFDLLLSDFRFADTVRFFFDLTSLFETRRLAGFRLLVFARAAIAEPSLHSSQHLALDILLDRLKLFLAFVTQLRRLIIISGDGIALFGPFGKHFKQMKCNL